MLNTTCTFLCIFFKVGHFDICIIDIIVYWYVHSICMLLCTLHIHMLSCMTQYQVCCNSATVVCTLVSNIYYKKIALVFFNISCANSIHVSDALMYCTIICTMISTLSNGNNIKQSYCVLVK